MESINFDINNNIFLEFLYGKDTIDVSRGNYKQFFENENMDSTKVTPANLLFVAQSIANSMTLESGLRFMSLSIIIASYILNKKGN